MEVLFKIDKTQRLIIETWPEVFSFEEYVRLKEQEFQDKDFDSKYNIITDLRNVEEISDSLFVLKMSAFIKQNAHMMQSAKTAVIADAPQTVASFLYMGKKNKNFKGKLSIFSSMDAALKWVHEKCHQKILT